MKAVIPRSTRKFCDGYNPEEMDLVDSVELVCVPLHEHVVRPRVGTHSGENRDPCFLRSIINLVRRKEDRDCLVIVADVYVVDLRLHRRPRHPHGSLVKRPGAVYNHVGVSTYRDQTLMIGYVNLRQRDLRTACQLNLHPARIYIDITEDDLRDFLLFDQVPANTLAHPTGST